MELYNPWTRAGGRRWGARDHDLTNLVAVLGRSDMVDTGRRIKTARAPDGDEQRRANDRLWRRGHLVKAYANRVLRPVEVLLLVRYREALSGSVLELGCGAGRLTGYLIEIANAVHGIDLAPSMIAYCRRRYPRGTFRVNDLRDVSVLEPASFDVVVAPNNVLDVLSDAERSTVLEGIHRVLAVGGLLIMSTHNRAVTPRLGAHLQLRHLGPIRFLATVIRLPRWLNNRRRVRPFEREEPEYAILNDISHDFLALHYYISREAQVLQLAACGFSVIECLDLDGRSVRDDDDSSDCPELHYVARRSADRTDPPPSDADGENLVPSVHGRLMAESRS